MRIAREHEFGVPLEPRAGLRGLYDRILVRRGVERALERTVANLEASLPR